MAKMKKITRFEFKDGYICYTTGYSALELKHEVLKHGQVISKKVVD